MSNDFYSSYNAYKNYQPSKLGRKDIKRFDLEIWDPAAFTSDMACLELGSGTGDFLQYLHHKGVQNFQGIDQDPNLKTVLKPEILTRFECVDIWEFLMSPLSTSWDRVVLLDVLEHFTPEDGFRLLSLITKGLNPRGKIVIKVPNGGSPWGMSYQAGDVTHKTTFNSGSLRQLAMASQLCVDNIYDQKRGSRRRVITDKILHKFLSWALINPPPFWGANIYAILSLK
jgi:cyclopropane fatty-acyl-phospholipid synthase-like methyltransferase